MLGVLIAGIAVYLLAKNVQATATANAEGNSVSIAAGVPRAPVDTSPSLPAGSADINGDAIAATAQNAHYLAPAPTPILTLRPITAGLPSAPAISRPIEFAGRMALKGLVE